MAKMHFKTCFKAFKAPFKDINDEIVQFSVEIEQKCAKGAQIELNSSEKIVRKSLKVQKSYENCTKLKFSIWFENSINTSSTYSI